MLEHITIIMSIVSLLTSLINLIISKIDDEHSPKMILNKKIDKISIEKSNKITDVNDAKEYLSYLSSTINKMYPKANLEISIHILKKNPSKIEESVVEHWISFPSDEQAIYKVKNNTDFNSILVENNKYFFVTDLNEYESLSNYVNENPDYTKWQTTIVFPIKNEEVDSSEIVGFLCVVSPEKFNNVKNNKKIISTFSKVSKLLSEVITKRIKVNSV